MDDAAVMTDLPDDPAMLKQIIVQRTQERDQWQHQHDELHQKHNVLHQRHDELHRQHDELNHQHEALQVTKLRLEVELLRLKKWYYGPRADRLSSLADVNQMLLGFAEALESRTVEGGEPMDVPETADIPTLRRVRRGRRNLSAFDHLPTTLCEHDLSEDQKLCPGCGQARQRIGQETSWQVEYIPGHFERIEHVRFKYACPACEQQAENPNIELADKPSQPIEKGLAGPGLLAYIVTSKYADYLPLYRLENIFERNGFAIDRSTQSLWCRDVAEILRPLYDLMVSRLLDCHVICTDDTVMPMLAPEKTRQARMWVYLGDESNPYNLFDFTLGRSRDGPMKFLKEYKQTLMADAYGGYDGVVVGNDLTRAGCWAHARRKFVDAEKTQSTIAAEAVGIIRQLYSIEHKAKEMNNQDRLALRQAESTPLLNHLQQRLWAWKDQLLPKHPMAEAVNYCLNQWQALNVFTTDGAVPIDNNASERQMKRIVLNRKNSLFVGNPRGGTTAAILSSFTSTCQRHDINPQHYLTQLLSNLPATPISQLLQWLPDVWKQNHAAVNNGV